MNADKLRAVRAMWTPKHYAAKIVAKDCNAVVYLMDDYGKPRAIGFAGNAGKPAFHFSFRSVERRAQYVAEFFANVKRAEESRAKRKADRVAFKHSLKVGDILRNSWGYDQTNVECFEVVKLVGESMVEAREIAQESVDTGFMQGSCVPVPGKFIGEAKRYRVLPGNVLDIHKASFGRAYPVERIEVAPGVKVARPAFWSSYA